MHWTYPSDKDGIPEYRDDAKQSVVGCSVAASENRVAAESSRTASSGLVK